MEGSGKRRRFDAAFKAEAVRLVTHGGLTQSQVARQLGVDAKRIAQWKKQMQQHGTPERAFPVKATTMTPNWLDFGVKWRLAYGARHFKKGGAHLRRASKTMRFSFIQEHRGQWPVGALCRTLGVTRPGYGAWQRRHEANQEVPSLHRQEDARLTLCIKAAHRQGRRLYGSPRVHRTLRQQGVCISRNSPDASSRIARRVPGTPQTLHHAVQPSAAGGRESLGAALYTRAGRHGETGSGVATSLTFPPQKAGCIWPQCKICFRGALWVGH